MALVTQVPRKISFTNIRLHALSPTTFQPQTLSFISLPPPTPLFPVSAFSYSTLVREAAAEGKSSIVYNAPTNPLKAVLRLIIGIGIVMATRAASHVFIPRLMTFLFNLIPTSLREGI